MAKKQKHEEHVNHERWLVSYADFITLLFAFFVILYALSEVDKNKLKKFAQSVQFAFAHVGSGGTFTQGREQKAKKPVVIGDSFPKGRRKADPGAYESFTSIVQYLDNSLMKWFQKEERSVVEVVEAGKAIVIRMPAERLFSPTGAVLRPDRLRFLEDFGEIVDNFPVMFAVNLTVDVPFGSVELTEHNLGSRRNDALISAIWRAKTLSRASFRTSVRVEENADITSMSPERSRSIFEFRITEAR